VCHCVVGASGLLGFEGSGGHGLASTALLGQEGNADGIDYNDQDSGRRHKRGVADDNNKQQERLFDIARQG
jgi:hypothetical protein